MDAETTVFAILECMEYALSELANFLARNSVRPSGTLPLVHTTQAYHLKHIKASNSIETRECDVFTPDRLTYFFVGRPAYKTDSDSQTAQYWELPCCFIFEFSAISNHRRVFPFDSGAFHKRLYPRYISKMRIEEFEVGASSDATGRIIGAFFGDTRSYFKLIPKDKLAFESEFSLTAFDEEVRALHKLSTQDFAMSFDDRRLTIEVQSDRQVDLQVTRPLAVVAPSVYFDDAGFRNHVVGVWGAQPISYPIHSLSISNYYALIYDRVEEFYKARGYL